MTSQNPSESDRNETITAIQSGDERAIEQIYLSYKAPFISWAAPRYSLSHADLTDCWQESVIAFYEQVASGRLQTLEVALKTYLFAIGRNKVLHKLRSRKSSIKREQAFAENYFLEEQQSSGYFDLDDIKEEQKEKLQKAMQSLSESNRSILISRYYDGLSLEKIQELGTYKSINAVSATLSRAVAVLKKMVHSEKSILILLSFYTLLQ